MKTTAIATFALLALTFGSCKEKKPTEERIIATRYTPKQPQGPIAMPTDSQTVSVEWQGNTYNVSIVRTPLDSVMVTDDNGQKYIDNRCQLTIKRQDGTEFLKRTFLKGSFLSFVKEPFHSSGILGGMCFVEVDKARLEFSAVVAMPDAADDLFIPLKVLIDAQGGLSISPDDDMGMLDYEDVDENEEG